MFQAVGQVGSLHSDLLGHRHRRLYLNLPRESRTDSSATRLVISSSSISLDDEDGLVVDTILFSDLSEAIVLP
jgi:hypothetical protein